MIRHPFTIRIIETLSDDKTAFEWAQQAFADGLAAGHWPPRKGPTGTESCAIASIAGSKEICAMATFFPCDTALADEDAKQAWIDLIYVSPPQRRWGIAKTMLAAIQATLPASITEIMFGTGLENSAMRRVAQVAGYEPDHTIYSLKIGDPA